MAQPQDAAEADSFRIYRMELKQMASKYIGWYWYRWPQNTQNGAGTDLLYT
jgi:hypothetical protein